MQERMKDQSKGNLDVAVDTCEGCYPSTLARISLQSQLQKAWNRLATGKVCRGPASTIAEVQSGAGCDQSRGALELSRPDGLHQRCAAMEVIGQSRQNSCAAELVLHGPPCKKQPAQGLPISRQVHLKVNVGTEANQSLHQLRRATSRQPGFLFLGIYCKLP